MMAQWRRPQFIIAAFLAIISLAAPSLVWACPVTGRTGTATQVCNPATSTAMPCCVKSQAIQCLKTCCKSVPQLPHDNEKINTLEPAHTSTATLLSQLSQAAHTLHIVGVLPVAPLVIEPSHVVNSAVDTSPPLLTAQHAPSAHAGRAPPSL